MTISVSATNPCHLWPLARELAASGALGTYYSGYPAWRLPDSEGLPVRTHSARTLVVYGLLRHVPERFRPANRSLFLWQDRAFDRWAARALAPCDFVHALPGQALETFRRARDLGIRTVLNHATGPVRHLNETMRPEFERVGLRLEEHSAFDDVYLERERAEYGLADFHCVASTLVRDQLLAEGVAPATIWVIPYGADPRTWHPPAEPPTRKPGDPFRILFAGQLSLRKGLRFLLEALEAAGPRAWRLDGYGPILDETKADRQAYGGSIPVHYHGPVSAARLGDAMRASDVLVLPSLEEGFGLVVVQALACGTPCVVTEAVGAKDLIDGHPERGMIIPAADSAALLEALERVSTDGCEAGGKVPSGLFRWEEAAASLLARSRDAVS